MKVSFQFALFAALALFLWLPAFALDQVLEVDASTLNKWISQRKGLVLIDVGSRGDFAEGHIPGSIYIPLDKNFGEQMKGLSQKKTYILICPTGRRSLTAAKIMMENGFEKVFNLKGGTVEWIRKGFKVSKGNE